MVSFALFHLEVCFSGDSKDSSIALEVCFSGNSSEFSSCSSGDSSGIVTFSPEFSSSSDCPNSSWFLIFC